VANRPEENAVVETTPARSDNAAPPGRRVGRAGKVMVMTVPALLQATGAVTWWGTGTAEAQNPSPRSAFVDIAPGRAIPHNVDGVIIEGLGSGNCSFSLSSVLQATVRSINQGKATITEFSPQPQCSTIAGYQAKSMATVNYVKAHAPNYRRFWAGIMLDEEDGFGFGVNSLIGLNKNVVGQMNALHSTAVLFTQDFSGTNVWSQRDYNNVIAGSVAAPQVATNYMRRLVAGSGARANLVTWSKTYPAPYNSLQASAGAVAGLPYFGNFYGTPGYWSDEFRAP
jgi:hypothetical protein